MRRARLALEQMWLVLRARAPSPDGAVAESAAALATLLASPTLDAELPAIAHHTRVVSDVYGRVYDQAHSARAAAFLAAIDEVKGRAEWTMLAEEVQASLLAPLRSRACEEADAAEHGVTCGACRATLTQMESDLAAVSGLKSQVLARIEELTAPEEPVERVRLASFFRSTLKSGADIDEALDRLRDHLYKVLEEGKRIVVE